MSKERLGEIEQDKALSNDDVVIDEEHYEWLIEQAERVQELESKLHQIKVLEGIIADRAKTLNAKDCKIEEIKKIYGELVSKYGELLEENEKIKNDIGTYKGVFEQNKRYREALEEILAESYEEAGLHLDTNMQLETFIAKIARKALEGEK